MHTVAPVLPSKEIIYPESDDQPIAENTIQFDYIMTIKGGLDAVFMHEPDVFVAGDLLWYPVEGNNKIRMAPDVMVALGRPKGDRGSYLQWREGKVPPQVVFEILSPGNRAGKMATKFEFYERYGVEEYYVFDPEEASLVGWQRLQNKLTLIPDIELGWTSPRLKVRLVVQEGKLQLFGPDGKSFSSYIELAELAGQAEKAKQRADKLAAQLRALGIEPEA